MKILNVEDLSSPIGKLTVICDSHFIIRLLFENDNCDREYKKLQAHYCGIDISGPNAVSEKCVEQLRAYFNGHLKQFTVRPALNGSTFENSIWNGLMKIPYGKTISYSALGRLCNVRGARAVGGAVGRNAIPIIIPCHRVIRSDGKLGGFSGGLERKISLLDLEGVSFDENKA